MRYPEKMECQPDRISDVRHPKKVERRPDKEDYFDKYFEMDTILIIFFLQINYFGLKLNSITKNYENKFTLILKHFKIMEVVKVTCREENGGKIY